MTFFLQEVVVNPWINIFCHHLSLSFCPLRMERNHLSRFKEGLFWEWSDFQSEVTFRSYLSRTLKPLDETIFPPLSQSLTYSTGHRASFCQSVLPNTPSSVQGISIAFLVPKSKVCVKCFGWGKILDNISQKKESKKKIQKTKVKLFWGLSRLVVKISPVGSNQGVRPLSITAGYKIWWIVRVFVLACTQAGI